jgi:hypothetical protein
MRLRSAKQRRTLHGPGGGKNCKSTTHAKPPKIDDDRLFYELLKWDKKEKNWILKEKHTVSQLGNSVSIDLPQGGTLTLYPNYASSMVCKAVQEEVLGNSPEDECGVFRQYKMQNGHEPRLHALVSCDPEDKPAPNRSQADSACTYKYHGIHMKAHEHISKYPAMEKLSAQAAFDSKLASSSWSVGCDVLLYRNGRDRIGFHADDTQGETVIFCVVALSEDVRCLQIQPVGLRKDYVDGDYHLKVYAGQGDAYAMDGKENMHTYIHVYSLMYQHGCNDEKTNRMRVSSLC